MSVIDIFTTYNIYTMENHPTAYSPPKCFNKYKCARQSKKQHTLPSFKSQVKPRRRRSSHENRVIQNPPHVKGRLETIIEENEESPKTKTRSIKRQGKVIGRFTVFDVSPSPTPKKVVKVGRFTVEDSTSPRASPSPTRKKVIKIERFTIEEPLSPSPKASHRKSK
jgi:hypothetical protein